MRTPIKTAPLVALTLALGLASCSGGGSSSAPGTYVEFSLASTTAVEGGPSVDVAVRLVTDQPALGRDAVVVLRNAGTGNALAGGDFAAFAEIPLTFPAGTTSGAEQLVSITPLDDALVEGAAEILRLALAYESGGAAIGARATHKVEIVDADVATLAFASSSFTTLDESAQSVAVAVALALPPATTLATPLSVRVSDAGTGSATSGADYAAFSPRTVSFAATSADGALASVSVVVRSDAQTEALEDIVLALSSPSAGAAIGANALHALSITDDDQLAPSTMRVSSGGHTHANGGAVDVGTQFSGFGPNGGVVLEVENTGSTPLALDLPVIQGDDERDFSLELVAATASGALLDALPAHSSPVRRAASEAELDELEIDAEALAATVAHDRGLWFDFPLAGRDVVLELERAPWPWTADAELAIDGESAGTPEPGAFGNLSLWRGALLGEEASDVFLAVSERGVRGWIQTNGTRVVLEPLLDGSGRSRSADERDLIAFARERPGVSCDPLEPDALPTSTNAAPEGTASGTSLAQCRLALESDHQLFQRLGGTENVGAYVTALIAAVSARYQIDAQSELVIAYLGVHSQGNDGWTTPDQPGTTSQMLDEFRAAWAPSQGGSWPASAHLAHFLSGATLGGGIAYLGVLCNPNFGFGVSGNLNGAIDWGAWSGASSPLTWDFVVVAHELGHNFAAGHTHSYCPPLDQCAINCDGGAVCSTGTLMSYCHLCAGGISNIELYFHPFIANVMRSAVNTSCLAGASIADNERLLWRVRFAPESGGGLRTATLSFEHAATNTATPFTLELQGTAIP